MFMKQEFNKMIRDFLLSVTVVLLLSSGAFADVGQTGGFSVGAMNVVQKVGGAGWAEGGNLVMVGQGQEARKVGTMARQNETGKLTQSASVVGTCGATKVMQNASIHGLQGQVAVLGKHGYQAQGQSLAVGLDSVIRQSGGIGSATSVQDFVGSQHQLLVTPNGTSANYQIVGAAQFSSVSACPGSNVVVINTLDIKMGQNQIAAGLYAPAAPKPPCNP
jgi:hypothetical protein